MILTESLDHSIEIEDIEIVLTFYIDRFLIMLEITEEETRIMAMEILITMLISNKPRMGFYKNN